MKTFLIKPTIIIFTLLLQGCIASAILGTTAAYTKVNTDPRTMGMQIDDSTLKFRINVALLKNKMLKRTRISVIVYQNQVLLLGQSPNFELSSHAEQIAMSVNGVKKVFNEIRQKQPISWKTTLSDICITIKVCSRLLISDQVKFSNVELSTEDGEVFMLGLVTEHEGKAAANIASQVNGVRQIRTAFTYIR